MIQTPEAKASVHNPVSPNKTGKLLIVAGIPAYNEEKTIAKVVLSAQKNSHKVIVCDDGSGDLTGEIAERLGAVVIRHEKNLGYGAALQSLFKYAKTLNADVLVTLDSDGQHDPEQIPLLVKAIQEGLADVVLGSRFIDKSGTAEMPAYRQFGVKIITKLSNGSGTNSVSDAQSGYRAYSKHAIDTIETVTLSETGMGASIEILRVINKCGLKICEVAISCKYGENKGVATSTKHPVTHGIGLIMSLIRLVVEDRPITFLGIPSLILLVLGIFFGIWMMDIYAVSHLIITNLALACIAFTLIGFFMMSTAITLYAITRITKRTGR